ncbi:MAG: DUF58 domain-containing protein [Deltaproteobacteria bacterium]|nr:DUF58 domain-containing protein [Deltaproteobacteria bacterium]
MEAWEERLPSLFIIPLVLVAVGLFFFIALLYNQRDLICLAILIFGVVGGAKIWGRTSFSGITYHATIDKTKAFPGENFTLNIDVENAKFLPVWLQVNITADSAVLPASQETVLSGESGLFWHQRARFSWDLTAQRRGVHPIGPARVRAGDLLGFFPEERKEDDLYVIVYPRIIPLKHFAVSKRDLFGVPGTQSPVKDPIYILGTRDYQHGQPAKYIHWKASARHSRLQEKVFDHSEQEKILLAIDVELFSSNRAEEEFERTLEIAASLAVQLDRQGYSLGLVTNGNLTGGKSAILPIARNPQQLSAILEALARLRMEPGMDFRDTLERGLSLPWGVSCVLFTLEADEKAHAVEEYFALRKIPIICMAARVPSMSEAKRRWLRTKIYHGEDIRL